MSIISSRSTCMEVEGSHRVRPQGSSNLGQRQLPQLFHIRSVDQTLCGVQDVILHNKEALRGGNKYKMIFSSQKLIRLTTSCKVLPGRVTEAKPLSNMQNCPAESRDLTKFTSLSSPMCNSAQTSEVSRMTTSQNSHYNFIKPIM